MRPENLFELHQREYLNNGFVRSRHFIGASQVDS